jgi:hypothetical protein
LVVDTFWTENVMDTAAAVGAIRSLSLGERLEIVFRM